MLGYVDTKELEALDWLRYSPVDVKGPVRPFPDVHDPLLCLAHIEGDVGVLAPHCQVSDLLPVGRLIVVGDQAYYCCVVSKHNDGVGVMGKQGVQEGTKHAPLR